MKYKIVGFNSKENHHELKDENGIARRIDLFVIGSAVGFGRRREINPQNYLKKMQSYIGKWVEIDRTSAFLEIGYGVKLLKNGHAIKDIKKVLRKEQVDE